METFNTLNNKSVEEKMGELKSFGWIENWRATLSPRSIIPQ